MAATAAKSDDGDCAKDRVWWMFCCLLVCCWDEEESAAELYALLKCI